MCNFCNNIPEEKDFFKLKYWDRTTGIVYSKDQNQFYYYVNCDDYYYSGPEISHMKYCPICGNKLIFKESI